MHVLVGGTLAEGWVVDDTGAPVRLCRPCPLPIKVAGIEAKPNCYAWDQHHALRQNSSYTTIALCMWVVLYARWFVAGPKNVTMLKL